MSDVTFWQYLAVALVSFAAATLGGIAGYGTGLLLPPVLVPIVGLAALLTNASRLLAFRHHFDAKRAGLILACALPTCFLGAYGYTLLSGAGITLLIGTMLIVLVPVRRTLMRLHGHMGARGTAAAGLGFGLIAGGTTGAGVVLISILLATGLNGAAVIATDAGIAIALGLAKSLVFGASGLLPLPSLVMALLIGACAMPGAFVARHLTAGLSSRHHTVILDAVVVLGGALLIAEGLRQLR